MNLASLLTNAVLPKLFHGWVRIRSLKSGDEHLEWNKAEVFGILPCRAIGGGKALVSLGRCLILRYRFVVSNRTCGRSVPKPCLSLTPVCSAAGPWALHSSHTCSALGIASEFNMMQGMTHCSIGSWKEIHNPRSLRSTTKQFVQWG